MRTSPRHIFVTLRIVCCKKPNRPGATAWKIPTPAILNCQNLIAKTWRYFYLVFSKFYLCLALTCWPRFQALPKPPSCSKNFCAKTKVPWHVADVQRADSSYSRNLRLWSPSDLPQKYNILLSLRFARSFFKRERSFKRAIFLYSLRTLNLLARAPQLQ